MLTHRRKPQSTSLWGHMGAMNPDFAIDPSTKPVLLPLGPHRLFLEPAAFTFGDSPTLELGCYSLLSALDPTRSLAPTVSTLCPLYIQLLIAETIRSH